MTTAPIQPQQTETAPPTALTMRLYGQHLIEASAGTGKTWTLSALIVRLIAERQFSTSQIIATTFTRAAAAELRGRVRERLSEVWVWLDRFNQHPADMLQQLEDHPDPLLSYLIGTLDADGRAYAVNLLKAALPSFDQMFIGTLDSFCQKMLTEFAFDSGQGEVLRISEEEHALRQQIIHDTLRKWRSEQDPRLIEIMVMTGQLTTVADHENNVGTVLNFPAAELAQPAMPPIDFTALDDLMAHVATLDPNTFDAFIGKDSAAYGFLRKAGSLSKHGHVLRDFIEKIQRFGVQVLLAIHKDDVEAALLKDLLAPDKQFNKGGEQYAAALKQCDGTALLQQVATLREQLTEQLKQVNVCVQYQLSQAVREQLPILLAERGETSFAEQMRLLADALHNGEDGRTLAKQIRHRYPVALVDEFQDTNSDQDRMIAQIWRHIPSPNEPPAQGCLVLVGDPKQAIYGFRGGDVQTYLAAREQIKRDGKMYQLGVNQRSVPALVQAVDLLFQRHTALGEGIDYPPVQASERPHPPLIDGADITRLDQHNIAPLRWTTLVEQQDELSQIAWQIGQLLTDAQRGQLHLGDQPLQPEHIAVLGYSRNELDTVQTLLARAQIPVWRPSRVSVFASPIAQDIAALMHVMLSPYHEQRLRRALSGPLVGWSLGQLAVLETQTTRLADLQALFAEEGQRWLRFGFLAAWQRLSEQLEVLLVLAQHAHGERHLVNLRHLLELLHARSERMAGPHHLLAWLMRQIANPDPRDADLERRLPSQSGVQLMTIHGSKGLEFPIVFVTGLGKSHHKHEDVLFYLNGRKRMIGFEKIDPQIVEAHHQRTEAEHRRLTYVALTRAKHRLYLYVKTDAIKTKSNAHPAPLLHWIDPHNLTWIAEHPLVMCVQPAIMADPHARYLTRRSSVDLVARPLPSHRMTAWGMTSFSAMIRDLDHSRLSVAVDQKDYEQAYADPLTLDDPTTGFDELHSADDLPPSVLPVAEWGSVSATVLASPADETPPAWLSAPPELDWPSDAPVDLSSVDAPAVEWAGAAEDAADLTEPRPDWPDWAEPVALDATAPAPVDDDSARFAFSGGTSSGECLHKILEYLDPTKPDIWQDTFRRQMQKHAVSGVQPEQLTGWFRHILHAALPDGATLAGLGFRARIREMEFHLSLPHGHIDDYALIARMQRDGIAVPALRHTQHVRYLKGAIDLVYQHGERFYVADYKSNRLGNQLEDYQLSNMQHNMTESGYWLQAALYLVALHRYLQARKADYDIRRHLGGACYLYLRGMRQDLPSRGVLHWSPDPQLILDLDAILGRQP